MESLVTLNVENNELRRLPPEVALLPSLRNLLVRQNPQPHIKAHVIDAGSAAVLRCGLALVSRSQRLAARPFTREYPLVIPCASSALSF